MKVIHLFATLHIVSAFSFPATSKFSSIRLVSTKIHHHHHHHHHDETEVKKNFMGGAIAFITGLTIAGQVAFATPTTTTTTNVQFENSIQTIIDSSIQVETPAIQSTATFLSIGAPKIGGGASFETLDFSLPSYNELSTDSDGPSKETTKSAPAFSIEIPELKTVSEISSGKADEDTIKKVKVEEKEALKQSEKDDKEALKQAEKEKEAQKKAEKEEKEALKQAEKEKEAQKQAEKEEKERLKEEARLARKEAERQKQQEMIARQKAAEAAEAARTNVVEEVKKTDYSDSTKISTPSTTSQVSAPDIKLPELSIPDVKIPSFNALKIDVPQIDVSKLDIPKIDVSSVTNIYGGGSVEDEELLEPQEVRDDKAREANTRFKKLDDNAKDIERKAQAAREEAKEAKKVASEAKKLACKTRFGGQVLCIRPFSSGY